VVPPHHGWRRESPLQSCGQVARECWPASLSPPMRPKHEIQASRFSASGRKCPLSPDRDRSVPLMPAHACSLVWRGTLLVCFLVFSAAFEAVKYGHLGKVIWISCDYLMYYAPPSPRVRVWFMRRFDFLCDVLFSPAKRKKDFFPPDGHILDFVKSQGNFTHATKM
jgi:hypothetical protein